MIHKEVDVLIIGGGLTGAALMLALQGLGFSSLLVDANPQSTKINPDFDARSLALSPASHAILSMLGVWPFLEHHATPIERIHVSSQRHFGVSRLQAESHAPLGYVVEMQAINQALQHLLPQNQVLAPAVLHALDVAQRQAILVTDSGEVRVRANLIVAADGTHSSVRRLCHLSASTKSYNQHALVANIGLLRSHEHCAYERFTAHGPIALLPMRDKRMSLVWAAPPKEIEHLIALSDKEFLSQLQRAFGYRLGRFAQVGKRFSYPLQRVLMPMQAQWPVVFVGNAAHTLHPVAGQGFNLGLRDVAALAQCIAAYGLKEAMLSHYLMLRQADQKAIIRLTDGLIQVFTSRLPGFSVVRGLGLMAFDMIPALKQSLSRYAGGFGGVLSDLVCQIALTKHEVEHE